MPELIIKHKGTKALRALEVFAKYFDFVIEKPKSKKVTANDNGKTALPIAFAENSDFTVLAGIWKDKDITLGKLRKKAWGGRS